MMVFLAKERKKALGLFLFALLYALFIFVFRKYIVGDTHNYGGAFIAKLLSAPIDSVLEAVKVFKWKIFIKIFYPYAILLVGALVYSFRQKKISALMFLGLIFPHYFLHFLANKFHFQYGVAAICPLIGFILGSDILDLLHRDRKKNLLLFNDSSHFKWNGISHQIFSDHCEEI